MKLSYPVPHQLLVQVPSDTARLTDFIVATALWALTVQHILALEIWLRLGATWRWSDLLGLVLAGLALHFTYRLIWREVVIGCRFDRQQRHLFLRRSRFWGWRSQVCLPWTALHDVRLVGDHRDADYWCVQLTLIERDRIKTLRIGERSPYTDLLLAQVNEIRRFLGWTTLRF